MLRAPGFYPCSDNRPHLRAVSPHLGTPALAGQARVPCTVAVSSQPHLVDVDLVPFHVVSVIDLPAIHKLHQKDPLGGQLPEDLGNLQ